MKFSKQVLVLLLCCSFVRVTAQAESFGPTGQSNHQQLPPPVHQSAKELQQLVASIALYAGALVRQMPAASIYSAEIVEADTRAQAMTAYAPDSIWQRGMSDVHE